MAKSHTLQGTDYGINWDYPDEIVQAWSRLWSDYKQAKPIYSKGKVYIAFQAKLVINGEVTRDEYPDWKDILKGSRVEHNAKHPDSKAAYSGRGRGRERGGGRGCGRRRERSQHGPRGSRDQVRDRGPVAQPAVMSVKMKSKWGLLVRGTTMKMAFSKALTALLGQHNRPDNPGAVGAVSVQPKISTVTVRPCSD